MQASAPKKGETPAVSRFAGISEEDPLEVTEPAGFSKTLRWLIDHPESLTFAGACLLFFGLIWIWPDVVEKNKTIRESIREFLLSGIEPRPNSELKTWMAVFFVGLAGVVFLALLYTLVTRAALLRSRRRCEAMRSQRDLLKGALSQIEKERDGLLEALQTERDRVEASFVSQNDRLRSTVDGFIRAASRIRSQLFPAAPPGLGKIIQSVRTTYHISRNFDAEVHRHYVIRAGERPLHFWQSSIDASGDAQPAEAFTDISFRLICRTPGKDVVYLPTKDERFAKAACIYFLPLIGKGEIRDIEIVYRWPGLMLQLAKTGWEDFTFDLNSAAPIDHFELEVFLEPGSGGQLSCSETGVQLPNASITQVKNDRGWVGWSYKASAIDTALLEHEIKARLEWRRS